MTWTAEQIEKIPEVYRDFMLVLKPIPDSRDRALKFKRIALSKIFNALRLKYQYEPEQIGALADNLKRAGLVDLDGLGFVWPTEKGESLIEAIVAWQEPEPLTIPQLPDL